LSFLCTMDFGSLRFPQSSRYVHFLAEQFKQREMETSATYLTRPWNIFNALPPTQRLSLNPKPAHAAKIKSSKLNSSPTTQLYPFQGPGAPLVSFPRTLNTCSPSDSMLNNFGLVHASTLPESMLHSKPPRFSVREFPSAPFASKVRAAVVWLVILAGKGARSQEMTWNGHRGATWRQLIRPTCDNCRLETRATNVLKVFSFKLKPKTRKGSDIF
jgi:hypothetical protein